MTYYSSQVARIAKQHLPGQATIEPVIRAKRMIEEHCCEAIDLDAIAREAFLSRYYFVRLFRRCYGRTPHQYLTERRIGEAKKLLSAGASVETACYQTGFASVPSFATLFRRHTGLTPSAWAKMSNIR